MNREDMVKAVAVIAIARKELSAMMSGRAFPVSMRSDVIGGLKGEGYNRFYPYFTEAHGLSPTMQAAFADYCAKLQGLIREKRKALRSCPDYRPLERHLNKTSVLALDVLKSVSTRRSRVSSLRAQPSPAGVKAHGTHDAVTVGPLWRERILNQGIATPNWSSKVCFVLTARPKPSTFLAADGIRCWEATVYMPDGTRQVTEGYVFRSEGEQGFAQFSTDFMRGAQIIKKRVAEAVLKKLEDA